MHTMDVRSVHSALALPDSPYLRCFKVFSTTNRYKFVLGGKELEVFLKAVDDAKSDLKWIRAMTGHETDYLPNERYRHKRSSNGLEDLLASFNVVNYYAEEDLPEVANDVESGDAWYSSFRSKECKNGGCTHQTLKYTKKSKKKKKHNKSKTKKLAKPSDKGTADENSNKEEDYEDQLEKKKFKLGKTEPEYDDYDSAKDTTSGKTVHQDKYKQNNDVPDQSRDMKYGNKDLADPYFAYQGYRGESNEQAQEVNYDGSLFDSLQPKSSDNSQAGPIELKDQLEKTQNDLSHEADYKLSKIEQEAMDKKSRGNRAWPLRHPDFQIPMLMQRKSVDVSSIGSSKSREYRQAAKRSVDPIGEIKLKTSERMMMKGLGASLPSDALDEIRIHENIEYNVQNDLEDQKRNTIDKFEKALWDRSTDSKKKIVNDEGQQHELNSRESSAVEDKMSTGRKLMSMSDYELLDDFDQHESNSDKRKDQKATEEASEHGKDAKLNDNPVEKSANYPLSYYNPKYSDINNNKMEGAEFHDKIKQKRSSKTSNDDDTITLDFSDGFLKGTDTDLCADPSKLVKPGSKLNSTKMAEASAAGTLIEKSDNKTISQSTPMTFKLNIEFNATVLNGTQGKGFNSGLIKSKDSDRKAPSKKSSEYPKDDSADQIVLEKRGIIFPPLPFDISKRTSDAVSKSIAKSTQESPIDCLMSGKLSAQLVNTIFRLVESNEKFRSHILPGLKSRKIKACTGCNNLAAIKTEENCDQINRSEQMLREVMETISAIIEQQVRSRTCIPLCTNLRDFYDLIIRTRSENDKMVREVKKRRARDRMERSHYLSKRDTSREPVVRRKYSVVKKLLNQYGYLPVEDQEKNKDLKDMLQMHLVYLKELEKHEIKRRKRELVSKTFLNQANAIKSRETEGDEISPKFMKLVRIAELIRKNSLLSENIDYPILQDYDQL